MKKIETINTPISALQRSKSPPELQFHAAATLIAPGDPFSTNPNDRQDKAGEVAQFCVPVPAKFVGRLKRIHVDKAFEALKEKMLERLRAHGVMANGE